MTYGWVKLYKAESPSFRRLPLVARGIATVLLKEADEAGFIDLGTADLKDMPAILKRALGGDKYDLRALQRHLPLLVKAGAFYIKDEGLQAAGPWSGHERGPTNPQPDTDPVQTSYQPSTDPIRTRYGPDTDLIEPPKPLESLGVVPRKKDRKTDIQSGVSGFKAEEVIREEFERFRVYVKSPWAVGRKDYASIMDAARKLIRYSSQRGVPFQAVVKASLRGYLAMDARSKDFSIHWWSVDPGKYVREDKLKRAIAELEGKPATKKTEAKPKPSDTGMSLKEAVESGALTPEEASNLARMGMIG